MNESLTNIETPPYKENLICIPYDKEVFLCINSLTRWRELDGDLIRDLDGEEEWRQMAEYVNKTYEEVFKSTYKYAIESKSR